MKFLFDASSMVQVIKSCEEEKTLRLLSENCILDLTKYEVGNALWKEHILHRTIGADEFRELLGLLRTIILRTKVLSVDARALPDVAEVAEKERITFYDASYITIAKVQKLTLVTEDTHLAKTAAKHTKTAAARDVL
jgi:predicted nucleic acid-binding protein